MDLIFDKSPRGGLLGDRIKVFRISPDLGTTVISAIFHLLGFGENRLVIVHVINNNEIIEGGRMTKIFFLCFVLPFSTFFALHKASFLHFLCPLFEAPNGHLLQ